MISKLNLKKYLILFCPIIIINLAQKKLFQNNYYFFKNKDEKIFNDILNIKEAILFNTT